MNSETLYIDDSAALIRLCTQLSNCSWLAVDTEFVREKTYYPQLCLIQIGSENTLACIDTLAIADLGPLLQLLQNPQCIKVFHAAGQDMELFYYLDGNLPKPVFDTQLAAALLGYGEQIGYANLVKLLLDRQLDKTQTRTDWSRRPLDAGQIEYALDDVRYLRDIYRTLRQKLIETDRLQWLEEDFTSLTSPERYRPKPEQAWQRIKSVNKLKGVRLNALKHLAAWREHEAMANNKPKKWILSDDQLTQLALQLPKTDEQLQRLRGFNASLAQHFGAKLLELLQIALAEPDSEWPKIRIPPKASAEQEALADMVTAVIRLKAAEHSISPQLLATRDQIQQLLRGQQDIPLLQGWRLQLAGQAVLDVLDSRLQLACKNGHPQLTSKI